MKVNKLTLNEEIVLSCAMRYALGRMTYVVSSVTSELLKNYDKLPLNTKRRISKEIQEHQNEFGKAGMDMDNNDWNKVKLLFNDENHVKVKANRFNTEIWEEHVAVKGDNGLYYSIPEMKEFYKVEEL